MVNDECSASISSFPVSSLVSNPSIRSEILCLVKSGPLKKGSSSSSLFLLSLFPLFRLEYTQYHV